MTTARDVLFTCDPTNPEARLVMADAALDLGDDFLAALLRGVTLDLSGEKIRGSLGTEFHRRYFVSRVGEWFHWWTGNELFESCESGETSPVSLVSYSEECRAVEKCMRHTKDMYIYRASGILSLSEDSMGFLTMPLLSHDSKGYLTGWTWSETNRGVTYAENYCSARSG